MNYFFHSIAQSNTRPVCATIGKSVGLWFSDLRTSDSADALKGHVFIESCKRNVLHRPYRTPSSRVESAFPTLKRGANEHCASGAATRAFLMQQSIAVPQRLQNKSGL